MSLSTVAVLCTIIYTVSCFSGLVPPTCGIYIDSYGCNEFINKDGDIVDRFDQDCYHDEACRAKCNETGKIMHWCGPPIFVPEKYTLAREDGKTSYVPGETVILKLETKNLGEQYRGLVMYAVNDPNDDSARVGDWEVLKSDRHFIKHDTTVADCQKTIMHKGAAEKPLITFFRFLAPEEGTGTVTIKAMLKTGNANTGEFYLPNAEYLTLTEAAPVESNHVLSTPGQSCEDACADLGRYCSADTLDISKADASEVVSNFPCSYPILATCDSETPLVESSFCYYRTADPDCTVQQFSCDEVSSTPRACVCGNKIPQNTDGANTDGANTDGANTDARNTDVSSGLRTHPSAIVAFLCSMLYAFSSRRNSVFFLLLAVLFISTAMPQAEAHNWLVTGARAAGTASRVFPCQNVRSSKPHIQVARGQKFQLEWATGHDRSVYFVLISREDEVMLNEHSTNVFDAYIDEALAANPSNNLVNQPEYQKQHRAFRSTVDTTQYSSTPGTAFPRPENCQIQKIGRTYQTLFYDTARMEEANSNRGNTDAVIIGFQSPTYSWIKGIWRYEIEYHNPSDQDVAEFYIPEEFDSGDYIIHYWWAGYYDCIDVNVVPELTPVELPCGNKTAGGQEQIRIDHCVYPDPTAFFGPPIKVIDGDLTPCTSKCNRHFGEGCTGVMFFPMNLDDTKVPDSMKNYFIDEFGIKSMNENEWLGPRLGRNNPPGFDLPNTNQANKGSDCRPLDFCDRLDRWYELYDSTALDQTKAQELRDSIAQMFRDATPDDMYCVPVQGRPLTNTEDTLYTTSDPRNPAFYSTCYSSIPKIEFPGFDDIKLGGVLGPYVFEDLCLDCESRKLGAAAVVNPTWTVLDGITEECQDCNSIVDYDKIPEPPVVEYEYGMHVSIPNAKCRVNRDGVVDSRIFDDRPDTNNGNVPYNNNDFRNQRGVDGGCPTDTICTILLGAEFGWGPSDTTYQPEVCARLAAANPDCDQTAVWIEHTSQTNKNRRFRGDWGCRCQSKLACCGGCELVRDGNADLYTITKTPAGLVAGREPFSNTTTCEEAGGTLSDDGRFCCDGRCAVCDRNQPQYATDGHYSCDRDEIDDLLNGRRVGWHFCDQVGPPCVMHHLRP